MTLTVFEVWPGGEGEQLGLRHVVRAGAGGAVGGGAWTVTVCVLATDSDTVKEKVFVPALPSVVVTSPIDTTGSGSSSKIVAVAWLSIRTALVAALRLR